MKPVQLSLTQASAELIIRALIEMPFKQVNQLIHYIDHEISVSQLQMPANTVTVAPAQHKYGVKADGTPKKRPGRQRKEVKL
jgi:hypothetical protein